MTGFRIGKTLTGVGILATESISRLITTTTDTVSHQCERTAYQYGLIQRIQRCSDRTNALRDTSSRCYNIFRYIF